MIELILPEWFDRTDVGIKRGAFGVCDGAIR